MAAFGVHHEWGKLREVVIARHSVEHWADGVLATVEQR